MTAEDQYNDTATGYAGWVSLTSTDIAASLPGNVNLTDGVGTFERYAGDVGQPDADGHGP